MTQDRGQQLQFSTGDLNAALQLLRSAMQRELDVIDAQKQDAVAAEAHDDVLRLGTLRDRLVRDLEVLQDQVPTLERLASGGVRPGREAAALIYAGKLAQAFLLAAGDIKHRASPVLSPLMIERLPAWVVESARASAADTDGAATLIQRALERLS